MASFTQLDDRDMGALAAAFDLGEVRAWSPIEAGTINSNFAVDTAAGRFCLRVNEGKSLKEVRYEAELVAALGAAGVPTPLPRVASTGERFFDYRGHLISAFPWIAGQHVSRITPAHAASIGRALAQLHVAGLAVAATFPRDSMYSFAAIRGRVADIEAGQATRPDPVLAPVLVEVHKEIDWLVARAPIRDAAPRGVIHGDLFPDNVLFAGHDIAALLDFEQASSGSLCYDLAVCINAWCFDRAFDPALIRALMDAYQAVRPLTPAEVSALPVELRAAAMRFVVTRITDVYLAGVDKPEKHFDHFLRRLMSWRRGGFVAPAPARGIIEE